MNTGKVLSWWRREDQEPCRAIKTATKQVRGILNDIQKASAAAVLAAETGSKTVESAVNQSAGTGDAIKELTRALQRRHRR